MVCWEGHNTISVGAWRICITLPLALSRQGRGEFTRGVQRGEAPLPRVWGCPQIPPIFSQEWGTKGVDINSDEASLGQ
jgi:hypothetical protein